MFSKFKKWRREYTFNISQPTVSKCVSNVCIALASLKPQFITFPEINVAQCVKQDFFFNVAGFPNVIDWRFSNCRLILDSCKIRES
jgi:hypothetical protein